MVRADDRPGRVSTQSVRVPHGGYKLRGPDYRVIQIESGVLANVAGASDGKAFARLRPSAQRLAFGNTELSLHSFHSRRSTWRSALCIGASRCPNRGNRREGAAWPGGIAEGKIATSQARKPPSRQTVTLTIIGA